MAVQNSQVWSYKIHFLFLYVVGGALRGERGGEKNLKIQNVGMRFGVRKVQLNLFKNVLRDVCFKGII